MKQLEMWILTIAIVILLMASCLVLIEIKETNNEETIIIQENNYNIGVHDLKNEQCRLVNPYTDYKELKEYERIAQAYAVKGEKPDAFDYNIAYITIKDKYKTT